MKKLLSIMVVFVSCSVQNGMNSDSASKNSIIVEATIDPSQKTQLETKWKNNTSTYTYGNYKGSVDVWGGGAIPMYVWFQDGVLWDRFVSCPETAKYELYVPVAYIDEYNAIVTLHPNASTGTSMLYVLRISNDVIYRSENPTDGFGAENSWDGKTVPAHNIIEIAQKI